MTDPDFYAAAERRIWRFQLAFAVLGMAVAWTLAGAPGLVGFAAGAGLSSLNFLWIKQAVDALVVKATAAGAPGSESDSIESAAAADSATADRRSLKPSGLIWKFLGRYALIGIAGYATLRYTAWSVKALLAGLFLFVAAILAEISVEIAIGLKQDQHGT
jgi:hypothetical protein